jgi:hypothetical protein
VADYAHRHFNHLADLHAKDSAVTSIWVGNYCLWPVLLGSMSSWNRSNSMHCCGIQEQDVERGL